MVLPYTRALVWLYLEGKSALDLKQEMDELTLPLPLDAELDDIREQALALPLSPATKLRLSRRTFNEQDRAVFEKLGYEEAYLKCVKAEDTIPGLKDAWQRVSALLRNPVLRIAVDVATLCKFNHEDLGQIIQATFKERLESQTLDLYYKYFFAHKTLQKADWKAFLKLNSTIPYAYIRYHAALARPAKEALYLVGLPTKNAFTDFLKTVLSTAEYKFSYYARDNTQTSDNQARAWAKLGFDAGVRYEKFSATDVTDFSRAVQTSFEMEDDTIETIDNQLLSEVKPPDVEAVLKSEPPSIAPSSPDPEPF